MDLDLAQVRAFVAVVDQGHFGRAAQTLALSQQALSKRIARLEDRVGPLVERRRGGVVPTAAGERFLPAARRLLDLADHAVADLRQAPAGPLRVDVWGDLQSPAHAIRAIAAELPDIALHLSMRRDLVEALVALERHELDLAFGNVSGLAQPLSSELTAELLMTDTIAALVSADSPLAGRDHIAPADLARHGLWFPLAGSSEELRAFAEEYARSVGAPLIADSANVGLEAVVQRVAADPTLIAPVVVTWPVGGDGVRVVPIRPAPEYPWYGVWRTANAHPSLRRVLAALRRAGERVAPRGV